MQIDKIERDNNKFITDFNELSDEDLKNCYSTNRAKLLNMMELKPEEVKEILLKVSACCAIMDDRNICHD